MSQDKWLIHEYTASESVNVRDFALEHGLILRTIEMDRVLYPGMYSASFDHAEVKEGRFLYGYSGTGRTRTGAIQSYLRQIEGRILVVNAYKDSRHEILVPRLFYREGEDGNGDRE